MTRSSDRFTIHAVGEQDLPGRIPRPEIQSGFPIVVAESGLLAIRGAILESEYHWHSYIGSEHLLLGVLPFVAPVLAEIDVRLVERLRGATLFILGKGEEPEPSKRGFTPRTRTVMGIAAGVAREGTEAISAEHILLALRLESEGLAGAILESSEVNPDIVRNAINTVRQKTQQTHGQLVYHLSLDEILTLYTSGLLQNVKELKRILDLREKYPRSA